MASISTLRAVFEYSEWLDMQGLLLGDCVTLDKRTHEELVNDFFDQYKP